MHLVVGLGNPGARYADTRHNVGFLVVDVLARRGGSTVDREQSGALVGKATVAGLPAVLVKPQKYMNLSGGPVHAARDFYKVPIEAIVVVHDDLDLPVGDVRVKVGGGHGGHNGLRDLLAHVGAAFVRVRVGIGRPPEGWDPADWVLARWSTEQSAALPETLDRAADAVERVLVQGAAAAMQTFNARGPGPDGPGRSGRARGDGGAPRGGPPAGEDGRRGGASASGGGAVPRRIAGSSPLPAALHRAPVGGGALSAALHRAPVGGGALSVALHRAPVGGGGGWRPTSHLRSRGVAPSGAAPRGRVPSACAGGLTP